MSGNTSLPPGMVEILKDPRVLELKPRPANMPRAGVTLQPSNPPATGDSPYLLFRTDYDEAVRAKVGWANRPIDAGPLGRGKGFPGLRNSPRPRFDEARAKPAALRDAWVYTSWLVASPRFVEIVRRHATDAIEAIEIDWVFADGAKLDGYQFLDILPLVHAYDYGRSNVIVEADERGKHVTQLGYPRALRGNLPRDLHVFREAYFPQDLFFSRELAKALVTAGLRQFYFEDPVSPFRVEF